MFCCAIYTYINTFIQTHIQIVYQTTVMFVWIWQGWNIYCTVVQVSHALKHSLTLTIRFKSKHVYCIC